MQRENELMTETIPSTTALLVIDLQNDVLPGCFDTERVLRNTRTLIERARAEGTPVVFVQHEDEGMPRGSHEWQFDPAIEPLDGEPRVYKTYRDSFADTELTRILDELGTERLVITGAQTDYCVITTTLSASGRGYDTVLVSDAHTTSDTDYDGVVTTGEQIVAHTNQTIGSLRQPGVTVGIATHDAVALR
jgi:nicotinamidase-related amidase